MNLKLDTEKISNNAKSFLSFKLGNEYFAINVAHIMEILEVPTITKVPHAPDYLIGIINLRGGVLPVIDTRIKFGMQSSDYTVNTCIVVLNINNGSESIVAGALVDSVSEVFELDQEQVQPSPSIGSKYKADFIQGMVKEKDRFMMLLNIEKVFSSPDMEILKESTEETANA